MSDTRKIQTRVAIVGGGPAGMAAARELASYGVDTLILDEGHRLGGQIFRQKPESFESGIGGRYTAPSHDAGHHLIDDVVASKVSVESGVTVWDVAPGQIFAEADGRLLTVHADHILLATGAMDRALAFPGWTLPGAMTPGAAQVMVRGQMLKPGQRAVVAGTGPLLLPTVTSLLAAGVEIVALLEANRFGGLIRSLPGVVFHAHRLREAMHYARCFVGAGVKMRFGHAVFSAHAGADGELRSVAFGRVDCDGRPVHGTEREVRADLLCVGYGLNPSTELAIRMGCEMHHLEARGGWLPAHDDDMRTSVTRVLVAGEIAGIGGADVAMAEGRLAGRVIAAELGLAQGRGLVALRRQCQKERRAADRLLSAFPVLPGLCDLVQPETIVCRCEDVTMSDLESASQVYGSDLRSIKMATRAGMGPCQARICHRIVGSLLRERCASSELPPPCPSVQVPVKPVLVQTIAERLV